MVAKKIKIPPHPTTLNIGYKTITIVQASLKDDDLYGCLEMAKSLITIDPDQEVGDYKSTLLHEVCHAGFEVFGLGSDEDMPQFGNEYLTTVVSNMIMVLRGLNPELFAYIFSQE